VQVEAGLRQRVRSEARLRALGRLRE
jgi:hypothetical protein